jgi:uncharacterized protein YajQ (UPF0234 family)
MCTRENTGKEGFMAGDCSFDIVSEFDEQELVNAIDQTRREIQTRYDLKNTKTEIEHDKKTITIVTDSTLTLKSVRDALDSKAVRRNLSLKIFKPGKEEDAAGRVLAKSRDELQAVIASLKEKDYAVPLQFINYRS